MKVHLFLLAMCAVAMTTAHGDSLNCRLVGGCDTSSFAVSVTVSGDYAYVAAEDAGLRIISIADPAHPAMAGYCETPAYCYHVAVVGNHV